MLKSDFISKFGTLRDSYVEQGITSVYSDIRDYFITGEAAEHTKKLLGKRYFLKLYLYNRLGYWPKIKYPRTFNEKIQHRKLYSNKDIFSTVEDKWRVREYVKNRIGEDILPEVYHVTGNPETMPFENLPNKYVIKPTHLSGGKNFIIDENTQVNTEQIKEKCSNWVNMTYGETKEEYWYSKIKPRIMIEEYLESEKYKAPIDYKFMVFHGEVKVIHATYNRFDSKETKRNFYTKDWNPIDVKLHFEQGDGIPQPKNLSDMINIAEVLGDEFEHIRVDLYSLNDGDIYFGEMTVAESSGANPFEPQKYDFVFGSYW